MSWQQLFGTDRDQPSWLKLALGVNAHISQDLPFALQAATIPTHYADNFFGLNTAIRNIAPELAPVFLPTIPNRLRHGIATLAVNTIVKWRKQAWSDFIQLEGGTLSPAEIERSAARRGRRLRKVSAALGSVGLAAA